MQDEGINREVVLDVDNVPDEMVVSAIPPDGGAAPDGREMISARWSSLVAEEYLQAEDSIDLRMPPPLVPVSTNWTSVFSERGRESLGNSQLSRLGDTRRVDNLPKDTTVGRFSPFRLVPSETLMGYAARTGSLSDKLSDSTRISGVQSRWRDYFRGTTFSSSSNCGLGTSGNLLDKISSTGEDTTRPGCDYPAYNFDGLHALEAASTNSASKEPDGRAMKQGVGRTMKDVLPLPALGHNLNLADISKVLVHHAGLTHDDASGAAHEDDPGIIFNREFTFSIIDSV